MAYKKIRIKDPIYHAEIFLFMSPEKELMDYLAKNYDNDPNPVMDYYSNGRVIRAFKTKIVDGRNFEIRRFYLWMPRFDYYRSEFCTLIHELNHLVMKVFDIKGVIMYRNDPNEQYTYYVDYLFTEFMKAIDKLHEVNYKSCKSAMDYMKECANKGR